MAVQFPVNKAAYYDNADFLDNCSTFSFSCWVRLDTVNVGNRQYAWAHYGAVNRMSLRKDNGGTEYWRFAAKAGGVAVVVDDTTGAVADDTWYHIAGTWKLNDASGLKIYRNGAQVGSAVSTTGQSSNYDSGGSVDLYLGAMKSANNYMTGSLEGLAIWAGTELDAGQIEALYFCGWPHLAGCPQPSVFYPLLGGVVSRFPDRSGQARHIETGTIDATTAAVATSGKWEEPDVGEGGIGLQGSAGPASPNAWVLSQEVTHPTATATVTGLSNGTAYEFAATALDESDNESGYSAVVEATPIAVSSVHTTQMIFLPK